MSGLRNGPPLAMTGYLDKEGRKLHSRKTRFFKLKDSALFNHRRKVRVVRGSKVLSGGGWGRRGWGRGGGVCGGRCGAGGGGTRSMGQRQGMESSARRWRGRRRLGGKWKPGNRGDAWIWRGVLSSEPPREEAMNAGPPLRRGDRRRRAGGRGGGPTSVSGREPSRMSCDEPFLTCALSYLAKRWLLCVLFWVS